MCHWRRNINVLWQPQPLKCEVLVLKKSKNFQKFWRLRRQNLEFFKFFPPKNWVFFKKVTPPLSRSPPTFIAPLNSSPITSNKLLKSLVLVVPRNFGIRGKAPEIRRRNRRFWKFWANFRKKWPKIIFWLHQLKFFDLDIWLTEIKTF